MLTRARTLITAAGIGLAIVAAPLAMAIGPTADADTMPARSPSEVYALLERAVPVRSGQDFFKGTTYMGSQEKNQRQILK